MLEKRLATLTGKKVCEIGPGTVTTAKDILEANGNEWFGIEPQAVDYEGRPTVRTHEGTVSSIPFEDESMDYVLANQSMEHWYEFKTSFRKGLSEIHRVLKPGGFANLNVPIHLHGHGIFVRGELSRIRSLFSASQWESVEFEEWRREYEPLDKWVGWPLGKIPDRKIPSADTASTWILEIIVKKAAVSRKRSLIEEVGPWWIDRKTDLHRIFRVHRTSRALSRRVDGVKSVLGRKQD
ncbi:MAG: class I SAM-dependent methyltransferase [Planctomycetaceae bacterium]